MAKKQGYIVYEDGRVWSIKTNKFLKAVPNDNGYLVNSLNSIHRLIAEEFIPNPHNLSQVNHIDGNKQNNHISNLEWCTNQQNTEHALAKTYKLKNRITNEVIEVYNLNKWCRENNLHSSSMNRMLSGTRKYYNTWTRGE